MRKRSAKSPAPATIRDLLAESIAASRERIVAAAAQPYAALEDVYCDVWVHAGERTPSGQIDVALVRTVGQGTPTYLVISPGNADVRDNDSPGEDSRLELRTPDALHHLVAALLQLIGAPAGAALLAGIGGSCTVEHEAGAR